ncbi:MAG: tetratricopeptide repeat protein [Candidatus Omnitrophica bacterium]|nr:tetratricopeptide repeat protein [Candidatus Omnitrophota bacterium]
MEQIKNPVNTKVRLGFIVILVLMIILSLVALKIYTSLKGNYSKQMDELKLKYETLAKENSALKNDYAKVNKDYQTLSTDRDNLIAQMKNLLIERNRAREMEGVLEAVKKEKEALEKDKQDMIGQSSRLTEEISRLDEIKERLTKEKIQLEQALSLEKDKSNTKNLEQEKTELQKINSALSNDLKQKQAELSKVKDDASKLKSALSKTEAEIKQLQKKTDTSEKRYADAVQKNISFEKKVIETPTKFAELARQNKALIKETANMHYNLGVFYMKGKEYTRAIAELEKTIELTPDDAYAHFNLGYIYAEYLVDRPKAIEHFSHYLRLSKSKDKDVDWVRKYILTWETYGGKQPME